MSDDAAERAYVRQFEKFELRASFDSIESLGTLRGRLEGCVLERDALRQQVLQLLDQRDSLVKLLNQAMEDGAAWRTRYREAIGEREGDAHVG